MLSDLKARLQYEQEVWEEEPWRGAQPPLKNCRKRRFRKTLRKKYVEAPEIEKEVGICVLKDMSVDYGSLGEEAVES